MREFCNVKRSAVVDSRFVPNSSLRIGPPWLLAGRTLRPGPVRSRRTRTSVVAGDGCAVSGLFGGEAYREGEQDDAGEAVDGAADTGPLEEGARTVECVGVS